MIRRLVAAQKFGRWTDPLSFCMRDHDLADVKAPVSTSKASQPSQPQLFNAPTTYAKERPRFRARPREGSDPDLLPPTSNFTMTYTTKWFAYCIKTLLS